MCSTIGTQQDQKPMTSGETMKREEAEAILRLFQVSPQTTYFSSTGFTLNGRPLWFSLSRAGNQAILSWVTFSGVENQGISSSTTLTVGT